MLPRNDPDRIQIVFDDHRLVTNAGLLLPVTLAHHLGLGEMVDRHVDLGDAPGRANAGEKVLTLVASTLAGGDCIDDADGMTGAVFAYQWLANDADIAGATGSSYTRTEADAGLPIRVRVSFTDDTGNVETLTGAPTLMAEFIDLPAEHDGPGSEFSFELRFSEHFPGRMDYKVLRDQAIQATNARVVGAKRAEPGRNQRWIIRVRPRSLDDVTVSLAATTDCDVTGAVCTDRGRPLSNANSVTVSGPPEISVADAQVAEGEGATLAFVVTLSRASSRAITVDYATSDGSAQSGADYTAASGTLTFQPGETSQTVRVAVWADTLDEGDETLTLTLTNSAPAWLNDSEATGTIRD